MSTCSMYEDMLPSPDRTPYFTYTVDGAFAFSSFLRELSKIKTNAHYNYTDSQNFSLESHTKISLMSTSDNISQYM